MALLKNLLMAIILLPSIPANFAHARNITLYEQEVKAGMLYNFLKYTRWSPASAVAPDITVCVFGDNDLNPYLKALGGRTVNQKTITIRYINTTNDAGNCHLLFFSAGEKARWPQLRKFLEHKTILTVSDLEGFVYTGGMIEFGKKDNRIQVELNTDTVRAAQLHIEDRLLKLVTVVHSPEPAGGQ